MKSKLTKLFTLLAVLLFGIGNVWGTEIFSWTVSSALAKNASEDATGGTVTCTGSAMGSETPSSSGYFKFNSSTQLTFTLSSGTFSAGDVISFTFTSGGNNKTVGVEIQETSPVTQLTETITTKGDAATKTYTIAASDGIQGQNKFSIKRVDSNFSFKSVSVTRGGGGGGDPVCPSGLTISSKNDQVSFTEGEKIELSAALSAGNGTITYQWYKGSVAPANAISGATNAKYEVNSCTTADDGDYFCVASKTSCSDAVNASAFTISVAADTKCFNMPAITSKPADLASVIVSGGTLSDVSTAKSVAMNAAGLKLDGNSVYLKVTLSGATITTGTKITVAWKNAGSGAGIALVNENLEEKVIDETSVSTDGSVSHTFTAAEAAYYSDAFILHRNSSGVGIYVNAITVEDCGPAVVKHTITLDYNDGATPSGSILVADGKAASQPADPTWAHHRFDGWYNGASPYDWASTVSGDITLTAHWTQLYTITYAAGDGTATGDAPTQVDKAENETFEVAANTFAVAGKDFEKWNDGTNDYAPGDTYTVGTADVVLTAQWKAEADKYTVIFKDGESTLDTKSFEVGTNPSDAGVDKTKALNTFAAWQKDAADIALNDAFWATVVKEATVTLTARWTKAYATDVDFETEAVGHAGDEDYAKSIVDAHYYALSTKTGTTFDENTSTNNGAYLGLKIKNAGTTLSWNVVADKVVELKAGVMVANGSLAINGGAATTIDGGSITAGNDNYKIHYFYSATEALYEFTTSNGSAEVIKAITMRDPYTVSFEAHGDADPSALPGQPSVTLPAATNGTASLLGWFDAETGGNKIGDAGDSYTPTANITLHAQWEAVSTDARLSAITLSDMSGVWSPAFDPEVVNYTYTMPYPTAAVPTITGATAVNANAKAPVIDAQAANWGDVAHIHGVAESDDTKDYYITMKIAPKDGVSIIKVATTGGTNKTVTGLYAGDGDVNLSSSKKMDNGKYIGFILNGTTLQTGDRINVHTTQAANTGGSHIIFYDNMTDKNELYETGEIGGTGDNIFTINAEMEGKATAYVYRSNADAAHQWNGYVDFIEVTRPMNPMLTAITINSRAGEIDPLDDKHFNVQIPYEADLAALTIVPTIVRNAPHATTPEAVISNEGAWILGDNTYRIMDKDGDYTDYTITLDRDVLKHTVSFNTHGGSAVPSVEVVDGQKLAAAPADPTKDDYLFQGWAETEDGTIVDVTSFTITADKEFHAVWASDGAIKLLDGATVNHTNFITGVTADETVEFMGNTVNYAKFSGTVSGVNGVKDLTRVIAYNATTNKTKIRISAHNNSTSGRNILVKGLVEGASEAVDLATIALGNKEDKISDWIEFNNAANRTIYIMVSSSAGDVYFTQVKVIESGETPMKQAGEAGYALNLNKGRFFGLASTDLAFEGLNARLSGDYTALNSSYAKLTETSMSFTVASAMTLSVTTNNNKTYYVTKGAAGTDNETAKTGVSEFDLTAGTWYITGGTAEVQITNIAFALPKCEQPTITTQPATKIDFPAGDLTASVTAHVNDGGTLSYQWYNASDDSEVSGADEATLTTTTEGTYYVIVTNSLSGYQANSIKSDEATLRYRTLNDATLSSLSYGDPETAIALEADKYDYRVILNEGTTEVPALHATATMDPYPTVAITDAATFTDYKAQSTVHVTAEDGTTELTYTVNFIVKHIYTALEDVTGSTTWNWSGSVDQKIDDVPNKGVIIANYIEGDNFEMIEGKAGEYARRNQNGGVYQGTYLHFNTTVPGKVKFYFRAPSSGENCTITVKNGGRTVVAGTRPNSFGWSDEVFVNGDVVVEMVNDKEGGGTTRVQQVVFTTADPNYTRNVTEGRYGTICLPNGGVMVGAMLYEVAYFGETSQKIFFDNIPSGEMEAGIPYIFLPNDGVSQLAVYYTDDANASAGHRNGLFGSYTEEVLTDYGNDYVLYNNQYLRVVDNGASVKVGANRAYIKLGEITPTAPALAPGRIRMAIGVTGHNTPTGLENGGLLNGENGVQKVLINGNLYILRGEKMFDATGRLVK